jgi:hypothetical protein
MPKLKPILNIIFRNDKNIKPNSQENLEASINPKFDYSKDNIEPQKTVKNKKMIFRNVTWKTIFIIPLISSFLLASVWALNSKLTTSIARNQVNISQDERIYSNTLKYKIFPYTNGKTWGLKDYNSNKIILEPKYKVLVTQPFADINKGLVSTLSNYAIALNAFRSGLVTNNDLANGIIDYSTGKVTMYESSYTDGKYVYQINESGTKVYDLENNLVMQSNKFIYSNLDDKYFVVKEKELYKLVDKNDKLLDLTSSYIIKKGSLIMTNQKLTFEEFKKLNPKAVNNNDYNTPYEDHYSDYSTFLYKFYDLNLNLIGQSLKSGDVSDEVSYFTDLKGDLNLFNKDSKLIQFIPNASVDKTIKTEDGLKLIIKHNYDNLNENQYNALDKNTQKKYSYEYDQKYKRVGLSIFSMNSNKLSEIQYSTIEANPVKSGIDGKVSVFKVSNDDSPSYKYLVNSKLETVFDPLTKGLELTYGPLEDDNLIVAKDLKTQNKVIYNLKESKKVFEDKGDDLTIKFVNGMVEVHKQKKIYLKLNQESDDYKYESTVTYYDFQLNKLYESDLVLTTKISDKLFIGKHGEYGSSTRDKTAKIYLINLANNSKVEMPNSELEYYQLSEDRFVSHISDYYSDKAIYTIYDFNGKQIATTEVKPLQISAKFDPTTKQNLPNSWYYYAVGNGKNYDLYDQKNKLIFSNYEGNVQMFIRGYLFTQSKDNVTTSCKYIIYDTIVDCK